MHAAEFLDGLTGASPEVLDEGFRQLEAANGDERDALRGEAVRRLAAGELDPELALAIVATVGAEPAVPDLVALLRSTAAPLSARAAALVLLRRHTTCDVRREVESLHDGTLPELVETAVAMNAVIDFAAQKGTPFERLALADPGGDEIDEIVEELLDAFRDSPEAAGAGDPDELRFWAGELVHFGIECGFGSPVLWEAVEVGELAGELLRRMASRGSAAEAREALQAFRAFFRWASRVAPVQHADAIDAELAEVGAGFGRQAAAATASRRKLEAAKKRKAKMAKLSRKKNRRK